MECKYCNTCVSLSPFELAMEQTFAPSDVHPAAAAELQDPSPLANTNPFKTNVSGVIFSNTQATFAINNEMYKHEAHLITNQLSELGLTLKSPMNRQVDLDIYPTSTLQSPADFGDITSRTINYQRKTTSLESTETNCQWPRRCYLLNTNRPSEELAEPMESTDLDHSFNRSNPSTQNKKRSLSQLNSTEIRQPTNGLIFSKKISFFFFPPFSPFFFFEKIQYITYMCIWVDLLDENQPKLGNDEVTMTKNKKMKKSSTINSSINPRKRPYTKFIADQTNHDNDNDNDNEKYNDEEISWVLFCCHNQKNYFTFFFPLFFLVRSLYFFFLKKKENFVSKETTIDITGHKYKLEAIFEPIPEENTETKENSNAQNNSIAPTKRLKRKREEMEGSHDTNESQQNGNANIGPSAKRPRIATTDINSSNELNIIQQHKSDCPFVQSHYYLGKSMYDGLGILCSSYCPKFTRIHRNLDQAKDLVCFLFFLFFVFKIIMVFSASEDKKVFLVMRYFFTQLNISLFTRKNKKHEIQNDERLTMKSKKKLKKISSYLQIDKNIQLNIAYKFFKNFVNLSRKLVIQQTKKTLDENSCICDIDL
ncbi:hypothetical protein RFI_04878 [Reticulomyxa filosa]|uniref:Uncharacterized protein n=1 Tax=Reticulomyxa filosa TaxID=46433 RepID=X6P2D4_RETFI|nr:hypothetical protein RFI_04878 [Reticulomyxa filosa]|eukprot:ETO32239.1 hypothetical protein RFI_04878 [Reticulomyxa filosa]